jgi:hypothetical protein
MGRKSAKARMKKISPERRKEIARQAAEKRWAERDQAKEKRGRTKRKS